MPSMSVILGNCAVYKVTSVEHVTMEYMISKLVLTLINAMNEQHQQPRCVDGRLHLLNSDWSLFISCFRRRKVYKNTHAKTGCHVTTLLWRTNVLTVRCQHAAMTYCWLPYNHNQSQVSKP